MERGPHIEPLTVPLSAAPVAIAPPKWRAPQHLAMLAAGHRRWARENGLPYGNLFGGGIAQLMELVTRCVDRGVGQLTICGHSDDLWLMSDHSAPAMLSAFRDGLWQAALKLQALGVRLQLRGDATCLDPTTLALLERLQRATQYNDGLLLVLGMDYRQPWLPEAGPTPPPGKAQRPGAGHAPKRRPDPDLLIRTGGTLSSCTGLLWDTRHTALYLTDCLWPNFNAAALDRALQWFGTRERRHWVHVRTTS
ncbi:undecaprenyl diphosphate synthase family protein [Hydrogenophaga sp.]|uniref:undecaprenyl diphosphate synthase family protein n=1 Tax=Hydrogenophaga sp. TaxID=1904254 RepID=UPI0035AEFF0E